VCSKNTKLPVYLFGARETVKLIDVIEEIVGERGLSRETLKSIVAAGLLAAYEKNILILCCALISIRIVAMWLLK
jgi:hypothetical protein